MHLLDFNLPSSYFAPNDTSIWSPNRFPNGHHQPQTSHYTLSSAWLNWSKGNTKMLQNIFITTPGIADTVFTNRLTKEELHYFIRGFWSIAASPSLCRTGRSSLMLSDWLLYTAVAVKEQRQKSAGNLWNIFNITSVRARKTPSFNLSLKTQFYCLYKEATKPHIIHNTGILLTVLQCF